MRTIILALLLLSSPAGAFAERNKLKPADFEPLTELPWKKPGATLDGVLDAIFREPNVSIRYPVLAEYLRTIPVGELGKAFDICTRLEGTQVPKQLVEFFLEIWAERDAQACWKKTRSLFHVVGIEDWLEYDSWKERPRITVRDLEAIRASPYWLASSALISFPLGVAHSSAPESEKVRIMKEFAAAWFDNFGTWPGYERERDREGYASYSSHMIEMFRSQADAHTFSSGSDSDDCNSFEIGLRRWMLAKPDEALKIIKKARETKWPPERGRTEPRSAGPSTELFTIWAKADLPAMIRWAESLDIHKDDLGEKVKGFLMSRVDADTRQRWLADAKSADEKDDHASALIETWAKWDPKAALDFAATAKDPRMIEDAVGGACWRTWDADNMRHCGLGAVQDFKFFDLLKKVRDEVAGELSQMVMEGWGEIDIGETARFGLDFMLRGNYVPRAGLIAFFSGKEVYPDEGGMIDRTFCALRVWAVVKPDEMKAWIATLKDAEMRKALTWLLQHPWGGGPKE